MVVQEALHLDAHQIKMAKHVWQQTSEELAGIRAETTTILQRIRHNDFQPQAWQTHASAKAAGTPHLLEQVSKLTENGLLQQEVLQHASRVLTWQICSPDTMARVFCYSWPAFPDLLGILQAMAEMSAV